ncbi:MAG: carboxy-S-adenosyl-L-methionine synthase CmoA [Pseudomonadota bacterium]
MMSKRDSLYASPLGQIADFNFDETVAEVFQDMIRRSVPGYAAVISAIGMLAARFARDHSRCYDLGCSLGAATLSLRRNIERNGCRIIAVDNSPAMIARCRENIAAEGDGIPVDLVCGDIRDISIENASLVVLNFTLQFIPVQYRLEFLSKICHGLLPGGALILSEKLGFVDPRQHQLYTDMHRAFKKAQGYSDLEISQKRAALEKVLIPETLNAHRQRLEAAGFESAEVWFQYFNFASMVALK